MGKRLIKKWADGLKEMVGPTAKEDSSAAIACTAKKVPVLRANPKYHNTPPERLRQIAYELCLSCLGVTA